MVTAFAKNNVHETQMIQLTAHKNLQSLNFYKKASMEQQKDMGHVLSSYSGPATGDVNDQYTSPFFQVLGCTINIGLPMSNTQTQQNVPIFEQL